jgi:hypothetical protein
MAWKEICIICLVSIAIMLVQPVSSASNDSLSDLKSAISSFNDPHMDADELAFYLSTHEFDAKPKGSYVEVDLSDEIYKLTPNGEAPGLCNVALW